jgi:hypothetical protein
MVKLEAYIGGSWTELNYFSNDIKLVRKRDDFNDLIIRTFCEGAFSFSCTEYALLLTYVNTYNQLPARITDYDCDLNETVYSGFLTLNFEIDFFKNIISGKFTLTDEYYNYFENQTFNGTTQLNLFTISGITANRVIHYKDNVNEDAFTYFAFDFQKTIDYFVKQIFGATYSFNQFTDFIICKNENWLKISEYEKQENQSLTVSLLTILNSLQEQFFIQWYIDGLELKLVYRRDFSIAGIDKVLTGYENANSKKITLDNAKISEYSIKTFDFESVEMSEFEKFFSTGLLSFIKQKANKKEVTTVLNSDIYYKSKDKINIIQTVKNPDLSFEYSDLTKTFTDTNNAFFSFIGDWDELSVIAGTDGNTVYRYFETDWIYIFNRSVAPQFSISFELDWSGEGYTAGDLQFYRNRNDAFAWHDVIEGNNFVFQLPNLANGWYKWQFRLKPNKVFGTIATPALIKNFRIYCLAEFSQTVYKSNVFGISVPNYILSNFYTLRFKNANLPNANGIHQQKPFNDQPGITTLQKTDFYQEIATNEQNLISSLDFAKLFTTDFGNMQLDKIEKTDKKMNYSLSKIY